VGAQIILVIIILSINLMRHFDIKKNIAYSTSIHLIVMFLIRLLEIYSSVIVYIMLHRIIKRQIFQGSGYSIHRVRTQDMRIFTGQVITYIIMVRIIMLSALVRIVIVGSKEMVVLGGIILVMVLLVVSSILYSVGYINKLIMGNRVREVEG
jgi:NADH:ubiquinone oxidoreductase subunit 5 (subunit L)/multisubunit Na+/H+ antiporter MnhA subunit